MILIQILNKSFDEKFAELCGFSPLASAKKPGRSHILLSKPAFNTG